MPRQPFLNKFRNGENPSFGSNQLKNFQEIAALVGSCISTWSYVDEEISDLFGLLIDSESEAARAVFLTIRKFGTQAEALQSAANHSLNAEENSVFKALLRAYKRLEDERNHYAHALFGILPGRQDLVLTISLDKSIRWRSGVLRNQKLGISDSDPHRLLREGAEVTMRTDLELLLGRVEGYWTSIHQFNHYLRWNRGDSQFLIANLHGNPELADFLK